MTNPSDPGHPHRPPAPGQPGGPGGQGDPYGPPPQPQQPGAVPGPRPPGPPPGPPQDQPPWTPPPRDPKGKGVVGALFDMNFDHMVTPKVVKIIYALALIPITLVALTMAWFGLAYLDQEYPGGEGEGFVAMVGLILLLSAPFVWILQVLMTRIFLEFVINQFKIGEYLRAIKDKD
ncbi:DUF4282 domain-containing protein [Actinomadura welshii]